jgi:hypothetical protein
MSPDRAERRSGGRDVEHGGDVHAAVQDQAGVATHALTPRASGAHNGVDVHLVDLAMGGQARF